MHWLFCKHWLRRSSTLGGAVIVTALMLGFPESGASVSSAPIAVRPVRKIAATPAVITVAPEIQKMLAFLKEHHVDEHNRSRLAESIVASAKKYSLNARLLASIMIVESRGNPFAISSQGAVGIMQVHLATWGVAAVDENVNLLKIEDNVDFGARILKDYVRRFGVVGAIRRYNGFVPGEPAWEESSERYLTKVQEVYGFELS
jgi:soluble lytic murein transglycosylase-like protein